LNRIIEHEPADLIATAQAGVRLNEFNAELMKRGQWLPLDPPDDGRATLGGVIATGSSGAQQCGYGPPRRYVIGMRVALANGKVVKVGGRVVKNVAGYDLCKLFTGSYGSLGVIVEITFKVRPRPQRETTVVASASSGTSLLQAARAILDQRLFPVALEIISARMARELEIEIDTNELLLLARFAGNEKGVEFQSKQATAVLRSHEITEIGVVSEDDFIWTRLAAVPLKFSEYPCRRAHVQRSELGPMIECAAGYDGALWQAGVADGRIRIIDHVLDAKDNTPFATMNNTMPDSAALQNLRRRIKDELDPQHVFSEYSFVKHRSLTS
jgi:FAD/FMN-containing dehydrogenase